MPNKPGILNWGAVLGATVGGVAGCGLAVPLAHALASHLGWSLVVGTASASFLSTAALATIGIVGIGIALGGVVLGAAIGGLILKSITSHSASQAAPSPTSPSHDLPRASEPLTPELEIDNGIPQRLWAQSIRSGSAIRQR
jgi:hypothetical protein